MCVPQADMRAAGRSRVGLFRPQPPALKGHAACSRCAGDKPHPTISSKADKMMSFARDIWDGVL